jgi:hypothetical protein
MLFNETPCNGRVDRRSWPTLAPRSALNLEGGPDFTFPRTSVRLRHLRRFSNQSAKADRSLRHALRRGRCLRDSNDHRSLRHRNGRRRDNGAHWCRGSGLGGTLAMEFDQRPSLIERRLDNTGPRRCNRSFVVKRLVLQTARLAWIPPCPDELATSVGGRIRPIVALPLSCG